MIEGGFAKGQKEREEGAGPWLTGRETPFVLLRRSNAAQRLLYGYPARTESCAWLRTANVTFDSMICYACRDAALV